MAFGDEMEREIRRRLMRVRRMTDKYAAQIQEEMKQSHPWANKTYAAEQGLYARSRVYRNSPGDVSAGVQAGYAEGVPYGIYLELSNSGRWAIVRPTMMKYYGIIQQDVKDTWSSSAPPQGGDITDGAFDE